MNPSNFQSSCISKCLLCGCHEAHLIECRDRHDGKLNVVICDGCGVVHNDPIPSACELSRFYSQQYRAVYKRTKEPKLKHAARYFPAVSRHIRKHWKHYQEADRILDVGCGSGEFLYLMREIGKQVTGLEPTRDYANHVRQKLGLDVVTGEIDTFGPAERFDHIRLCHVVEHLRDPVANLRTVSRWLSEMGTMYVEVPDFERYCRVKTPGRIFHYGHIYNFDHDTFTFMIRSAGLEIVERTGPTSAFLRRAPMGCAEPVLPAKVWAIADKASFYKMHKDGQLRSFGRMRRVLGKLRKICRESWVVLNSPNHATIATREARTLRSMLT